MARSITAGTMSVIILAILVGLIAAYAYRMATLAEVEEETLPPLITVPLSSTDLPAGRLIGMGDISLIQLAPADVEERFDEHLNVMMLSTEQIIGRVARKAIPTGQPFLTTDLYLEGEFPDVSHLLKPGYRAVTLPFPDMRRGPRPGTRVDVQFRAESRPANGNRVAIPETTVVLLEDVEVLIMDEPRQLAPPRGDDPTLVLSQRSTIRGENVRPTMVTLAVTLEQANILQAAQGRGQLNLLARSPEDALAVSTRLEDTGLTLEDILGIKPLPPPVVYATEVYRRGARSVNMFRAPNGDPSDPAIRRLPTFDPTTIPTADQPVP